MGGIERGSGCEAYENGEIVLIVDVSTGLTINDVPKKNKKGKRVA